MGSLALDAMFFGEGVIKMAWWSLLKVRRKWAAMRVPRLAECKMWAAPFEVGSTMDGASEVIVSRGAEDSGAAHGDHRALMSMPLRSGLPGTEP